MNEFAKAIADFGVVERKPVTEGRNMTMIVAPRDASAQPKQAARSAKPDANPAQ